MTDQPGSQDDSALVRETVIARLRSGVKAVMQNDRLLLEYNVRETAIAARLVVYLSALFPSHHVDADYSRHGLDMKTIDIPPECKDGTGQVRPDVIVHRRGVDGSNLLVVEIKKSASGADAACDIARIRAFRRAFGYTFGVFLDFPAGPDLNRRGVREHWETEIDPTI